MVLSELDRCYKHVLVINFKFTSMLVYVYVEIYINIIRLNCITDSLFLSHVVRVIAINFIQELAFTI